MEFKVETINLISKTGNTALIEKKLGIGNGNISRWKREIKLGKNSISSKNSSEDSQDKKIKQLKREISHLRMKLDILKKAVSIFSKDPNRYSDL